MSPSKHRYWRLVSDYIWHKGQSYRVDRLTRDTLLEILPSLEKKRHRWPAGDKTWQAGWDYAVNRRGACEPSTDTCWRPDPR